MRLERASQQSVHLLLSTLLHLCTIFFCYNCVCMCPIVTTGFNTIHHPSIHPSFHPSTYLSIQPCIYLCSAFSWFFIHSFFLSFFLSSQSSTFVRFCKRQRASEAMIVVFVNFFFFLFLPQPIIASFFLHKITPPPKN